MLTKTVGQCCNRAHIFLKKSIAVWYTFGSAVNFICILCAVLVIFRFSKYHHIDPKTPGIWSFRKSNKVVWLCAVSHWAESDSAQYLTARSPESDSAQSETILDFRTFQFPDSAQYLTVQSPTPRSITLRGVRLRAEWDNFGFSDISISRLCAVWYCAESDSVQYHTALSHVFCKCLRES